MQIIAIIVSGDTTTSKRPDIAYSREKTFSVACIKLHFPHIKHGDGEMIEVYLVSISNL